MRIIVTGGAGFIGINTVRHFIAGGHRVTIIDDLSRPGARANLDWLAGEGAEFDFAHVDVSDSDKLFDVFKLHREAEAIIHLAAQVGVSESLRCPRRDFDVNVIGTLNVLESVRNLGMDALVIYSSTNKVYGSLETEPMYEADSRYVWKSRTTISEDQPLSFITPYSCSKGAADQYMLEYHRSYGLDTTVLRQSCISGARQMGNEEQGWVVWFFAAHLYNRPIKLYGTGKQVRDILSVRDLLAVFDKVIENRKKAAGTAFNIGGGLENSISLLELITFIEAKSGRRVAYQSNEARQGDQRIYISDLSTARSELGWIPHFDLGDVLEEAWSWVASNPLVFQKSS